MTKTFTTVAAGLLAGVLLSGSAVAQTAGGDHMSTGAMTSGDNMSTGAMASGDHMSTGAMSKGRMTAAQKKKAAKMHKAAMTSGAMSSPQR